MKKAILLFSLIIFATACKEVSKSSEEKNSEDSSSQLEVNSNRTTAETIAYKNGFENWKNVSEIQFTFNVDRNGNHFERSWTWNPKTDAVTMKSAQDTVSYNRATMDTIAQKTDASFINDKYWLLAPYNLVWDNGIQTSEKENVIAPISKDTLNQLTIVYGNDGGYTPGDAYDFYFGKDFVIKEWVYRKGNDSVPSMTTTWEDYEGFNGLNIAKMHKDETGNFKLYFTNIKVK